MVVRLMIVGFLLVPGEAWSQDVRMGEAISRKAANARDLLIKGGIVMIPIGLCSVIALAVTIERLISLRRSRMAPQDYVRNLRDELSHDRDPVRTAIEYCDRHPCMLSTILRAGLVRFRQGPEAAVRAVEEAGSRAALKLKRTLRPLWVIFQLAPLLGLVGTVYGMITAFQGAASTGVGKGDRLAAGIYEAFVTTAAGISVAVPVLVLFHWLNTRTDTMIDAVDETADEVVDLVRAPRTARSAA
jgi:biopolymer transport protein ExbB